ncbi:MAG TPA: hypothetical protein VGH28_08830 [Polyangiaceae bacterium]|jgi:hypothetical protein
MDRAALDALEKNVAALRKRVAKRAVAAHDAKPRSRFDAAMAIFALGVFLFIAFFFGAVAGASIARVSGCRAIPIQGVATITVEERDCPACAVETVVTLDTDGNMTQHSVVTGDERSKVSPAVVRDLVEKMATSCFFEMRPSYAPAVGVGQVIVTTLALDGKTKAVRDDRGASGFEGPTIELGACLPPIELYAIEWQVEGIAGMHKPPRRPSPCETLSALARTSCKRNADAGRACDATDANPTCVHDAWAVVRSPDGGYEVAHGATNGETRRVPVNGRPTIEDRDGDLRVLVHRGAGPEDPWGERATAAVDTCLLHDFPVPKVLCVRDGASQPPWLPAMLQVPTDSEVARASHWLDGNTTRLAYEVDIEALPLRLRDAAGVIAVLPGPTLYAHGPPYDFNRRDEVAQDRAACRRLAPLSRAQPEDMWRTAVCERLEGQDAPSIVAAWRARCAGKREGVLAAACSEALTQIVATNLALVTPWSAP